MIIHLEKRLPVTDDVLRENAFTDSSLLVYQGVNLTLNNMFQLAGTKQPGYEFYINHNGTKVGTVALLINDNFDTGFTQGNIGITIYPEYRSGDLAVKAGYAVLPVFKHHQQKQYLMTFYEHNSLRKIFEEHTRNLGGRYLDKVDTPDGVVMRWVIDVE